MSNDIFDVISENSDRIGTFGHGFTATGHPVASAVALENIKNIEERRLVANAAETGAPAGHPEGCLDAFRNVIAECWRGMRAPQPGLSGARRRLA